MYAKTYFSTEYYLIIFIYLNFLSFGVTFAESISTPMSFVFGKRVAPLCSLVPMQTKCLEIPSRDHAGKTPNEDIIMPNNIKVVDGNQLNAIKSSGDQIVDSAANANCDHREIVRLRKKDIAGLLPGNVLMSNSGFSPLDPRCLIEVTEQSHPSFLWGIVKACGVNGLKAHVFMNRSVYTNWLLSWYQNPVTKNWSKNDSLAQTFSNCLEIPFGGHAGETKTRRAS